MALWACNSFFEHIITPLRHHKLFCSTLSAGGRQGCVGASCCYCCDPWVTWRDMPSLSSRVLSSKAVIQTPFSESHAAGRCTVWLLPSWRSAQADTLGPTLTSIAQVMVTFGGCTAKPSSYKARRRHPCAVQGWGKGWTGVSGGLHKHWL